MLKKIIRPLATFAISFALLLIPFALEGVFPFGNRQIMIIDSWHQYYPILQALHDKLISGQSLFYSWNSGGGTNFWLMMTYYAMSPLNLLSVFVSRAQLREFLFFITLFKIALGGSLFTVYLQAIHKRYDLSTTFFGMLYAFCGFFTAYYWNVMWLDVVAVLPLILLGLHRVVYDNKIVLYTLTLSYAIISNYYVAYFVCLFIALYSIVYVFGEANLSLERGIKRLLVLLLTSLLAVGMAAIVLLPVIKGMPLAYGLSSQDPTSYATYTTLFDTINRFLPFVKPSIVDGPPNLALGIVGTLFFIMYFIQPVHSTRQKLGYGLLFSFLIFSTNINYLNFIWHGLHFPNQVPFRFAFTISFLMLAVAYKAYLALDGKSRQTYLWLVFGSALYLIVAEKMVADQWFTNASYAILLLLFVYSVVFMLFLKGKIGRRRLAQLLVVVFAFEAAGIAGLAVAEAHSSGRDNYFADGEKVEQALSYWRDNVAEVSRLELSPFYSTNDPLLYQYRGISQFSSTANANYTTFTKLFGLSSNEPSNAYKYIPNTPIANGFLGVNYLIAKDEKLPSRHAGYQVIYQTGQLRLLKSRFPLAFGFAVKRDIYLDVLDNLSPFVRQQTWLEHATAETAPLFNTMAIAESSFDNMRLDTVNGIRYHYSNANAATGGHAKLVFEATGAEQTYLYFKNQNKKVTLEYAGKSFQFDPRRGVVMDVGKLSAGARIAVSFDVDAQQRGYFDLQAVNFDGEAYQAAYDKLAGSPYQIETFEDTVIKGTIGMPEDGVLYTSIPYDGGWLAIVDGVAGDIVPLRDAVVTVPLGSGEHSVEFYYQPPGFWQGRNYSLLALALFAILAILFHHYNKRQRTAAKLPAAATLANAVARQDSLYGDHLMAPLPDNRAPSATDAVPAADVQRQTAPLEAATDDLPPTAQGSDETSD